MVDDGGHSGVSGEGEDEGLGGVTGVNVGGFCER